MNYQIKPNNSCEDNYYAEPFKLYAKPAGMEYTIDMNEPFVHPKQFEYVVHAMENATENDSFCINLTTPGGAIHAVLPLLGAMENTHAHVHVHACSDVASAGTLVLLRADSVSLNNHIEIMFHQCRFGSYGPAYNVERQVEHILRSSKRLMREVYRHFFTEDELQRILTGTDWYMEKEEFIERYEKRSELLAADLADPEEQDPTDEEILAAIEAELASREPVKEDKKPARAKRTKKTVDTAK